MECKRAARLRQQGLYGLFSEIDSDFFCLQEIRLQAGQIELELPGYHKYWNYAERKGYSGTAVFTKHEPPLTVTRGLGKEEHDREGGRLLTLEYESFYLVNVYTPPTPSAAWAGSITAWPGMTISVLT